MQLEIVLCNKENIYIFCAEKDHAKKKTASVMVWGCINANGMGDLHICKGPIDVEVYVGILERHMLPSRRQLFPTCKTAEIVPK